MTVLEECPMRRLSILFTLTAMLLTALVALPLSHAQADNQPDNGPCNDAGSGDCLAEMKANPAPAVTPIAEDKDEVNAYSFFRVLPNTLEYNAPNGAVVNRMADGFNFVVVYAFQDGFAQLRNKLWVERSQLKRSYASPYTGVAIDHPLAFPIAWVIQTSIPSTSAGAANSPKTPPISRYTRVNIFATVHVGQWDWYLVGPGQWLEQRKVARVIPVGKPDGAGDKWVNVNLYEQVLTAYQGNTLIFATLISSGLPGWQTNVGTFKVWDHYKASPMTGAMGRSDYYSLPAVPYVMFFDNDISLHGTYWHDGFGFKHSHGCVNMSISDAQWVYNWMGDGDLTVNVIAGT
jgi:hypothetical protein